MLRGTPVSPGVAQGMAFVMSCVDGSAVPQRSIRPSEVDGERQRLDAAIVRAQAELLGLEVEVRDGIGENQANIFGAQRLILGDASWRWGAAAAGGVERASRGGHRPPCCGAEPGALWDAAVGPCDRPRAGVCVDPR